MLLSPVERLLDVFRAVSSGFVSSMSMSVNPGLGSCLGSSPSLYWFPEIEMVIMERSKLPELAASTSVQEQNTTDEEKSAATGLESVQWSRYRWRPASVLALGLRGAAQSQPGRLQAAAQSLGEKVSNVRVGALAGCC